MMGAGVPDSCLLVSFAASCGTTTETKLKNCNVYELFAKLISKYDFLSVRDENTFNIVKPMSKVGCQKHLDPVLIFDYCAWMPLKTKFDGYIVVYGYDYRICDPGVIESVKSFAREKKLKTVALGFQQSWCDVTYLPGPFELLSIFKNASYVITDTFHGTVFSIKFQKKFVSIVRDSNSEKMLDLLNAFSLSDRILSSDSVLSHLLEKPLDSSRILSILDKEKDLAMKYLVRCFGYGGVENDEV